MDSYSYSHQGVSEKLSGMCHTDIRPDHIQGAAIVVIDQW